MLYWETESKPWNCSFLKIIKLKKLKKFFIPNKNLFNK